MRQNLLRPLHPLRLLRLLRLLHPLLLMLRLVVRLAAVWMKKLWLPSGQNPWRRMKKTRDRPRLAAQGQGLAVIR